MLVSLLFAASLKGCVRLLLYDNGKEYETLCVIKDSIEPPKGYSDKLLLLDCGAGIEARKYTASYTGPRYIRTLSYQCFDLRQDQQIILDNIYNPKVLKR